MHGHTSTQVCIHLLLCVVVLKNIVECFWSLFNIGLYSFLGPFLLHVMDVFIVCFLMVMIFSTQYSLISVLTFKVQAGTGVAN